MSDKCYLKNYIGRGIRTIDPEGVYTLLLQLSTTRSRKYPKIHKEVQILTFWSNVHTPNEKMLQYISRIYASNKNYTCEIYPPILCNACGEKVTIFLYMIISTIWKTCLKQGNVQNYNMCIGWYAYGILFLC